MIQIELRCFLRLNGKALTETWQYQYLSDERGVPTLKPIT